MKLATPANTPGHNCTCADPIFCNWMQQRDKDNHDTRNVLANFALVRAGSDAHLHICAPHAIKRGYVRNGPSDWRDWHTVPLPQSKSLRDLVFGEEV